MVLVTEDDGTDSSGVAIIVGGTGMLSAALGVANIKGSKAKKTVEMSPSIIRGGSGELEPGIVLTVRF